MYQYLTKDDTLQAFRDLAGKLRVEAWGFIRTANPVLHRALELHFGDYNRAVEALNLDTATREGWKIYWEEARKQGRTMRKLEEELERDWPKPAVLPLPEAFAQIEQTPEFLSCHSEASIKILALCLFGDDRIVEPDTGLTVDVGDLARFVHPLIRRFAERTGELLEGLAAEPADPSMLALFDLLGRDGREEIQSLARDLGAHIPLRTGARPMVEDLLVQARQTRTLGRLIDLLVKRAREALEQSALPSRGLAKTSQELTEIREALHRAKLRMQEKAWADARQQILGILDSLKVTKEDILASLLSIGLPKAKPGISRRDLCGYLFDEAEKHGKLGGILTVLQDELSRQTEAARERQEKRLERVAEQRQQYAALFGVLCKEAGIAMPELGFDQTASDIEHGRLIRLLVEVGGLLGLISGKEFTHERFIYDVVWRKIPAAVPSHVFEVQVGGNLTEALARLKSAANLWNSKIFLVANSKDTEKARWMLGGSFPDIAQSMRFLAPAEVAEYVEMKRRLAEFERRFS